SYGTAEESDFMTIPFTARVVKPPGVLMQELEGEAVFLHIDRGQYLGLDDVGTRMWETLVAQDSIQAAYGALLTEYDVEPETLRADLAELVEKLVEHGLVAVDTP